jgi:hypothetical protein
MDLMDACKRRFGEERIDRNPPILGNRGAIVAAAIADVEPGAFADRDSAAAPEEAVGKAAQAPRANDFDLAHNSFRMMMSLSA